MGKTPSYPCAKVLHKQLPTLPTLRFHNTALYQASVPLGSTKYVHQNYARWYWYQFVPGTLMALFMMMNMMMINMMMMIAGGGGDDDDVVQNCDVSKQGFAEETISCGT